MNGTNKPSDSPFFNANGILQIWTRNGTQLSKSGELPIGKWCQGIAWSSNSRTLLVQCMVEEEITVVRYSGLTGRSLQKVGTIKTKGGPAGIAHRAALTGRRRDKQGSCGGTPLHSPDRTPGAVDAGDIARRPSRLRAARTCCLRPRN